MNKHEHNPTRVRTERGTTTRYFKAQQNQPPFQPHFLRLKQQLTFGGVWQTSLHWACFMILHPKKTILKIDFLTERVYRNSTYI